MKFIRRASDVIELHQGQFYGSYTDHHLVGSAFIFLVSTLDPAVRLLFNRCDINFSIICRLPLQIFCLERALSLSFLKCLMSRL